MKTAIKDVLLVLGGAAGGSCATYFIMRNRKTGSDEEVHEKITEGTNEDNEIFMNDKILAQRNREKPDLATYIKKLQEEVDDNDELFDEPDSSDSYEIAEWVYDDGFYLKEEYNIYTDTTIVNNIFKRMVGGIEARDTFIESEDEKMYIRDDNTERDYCIFK